jgi:excisionase family DNA binding protein
MNEYLTMEQAAELMGVSWHTIHRRIKRGDLPAYQSGTDRRLRLVKREDVEKLMKPRPIARGEEQRVPSGVRADAEEPLPAGVTVG